jgi:hypothetical protein
MLVMIIPKNQNIQILQHQAYPEIEKIKGEGTALNPPHPP